MRVTIKDVAKEARVSIATVSRVFNGYTDISEATKNRIMKIAKEMDYLPNTAARSLASKTQVTIALILNDFEMNRKSTMAMEVLSGVYDYTEEHQIEFVFFATSRIKQGKKSFREFCNEKAITGAVVQGLKVNDPYYKEILESQLPVALIDMWADKESICSISIDNVKASTEAVAYLIDQGHQHIGMINGRREAAVSIDRETGYVNALKKHQIPLTENYVQYANFNEKIAVEIARDLLINQPQLTALFCASDLMAIGAMKAVGELGLSIPEDISIIGFDDIILNEYLVPKLSSISQNMEKIGYEAAKNVYKLIKKEVAERQVYIEHGLIIRESVGPAVKKLRSM